MKKLIFIFLLFPLLLFSQTNYYVSTTGNNGNPGTLELPWRNNWYACSQVTGGNNINTMSGTYAEGTQWILASGVNMYALGGVRIESSFAATGQPLIKLESTNGWLHPEYIGHQEISGYTFDGNMTTYAAVYVNFRHYVKIHNCTFIGFVNNAIKIMGQPDYLWTTDNPYSDSGSSYPVFPDYWCLGNEIYNCTITDCSRKRSTSASHAVDIGVQNGLKFYNNVVTAIDRPTGENGYGIGFCSDGFNKNCKIYDNDITVSPLGDSPYEFAIEWWWDLGGTEIYDNRIIGAIDIVHCVDHHSMGYAVNIYKNEIGYNSTPSTAERAILIEGRCEYLNIYNNYIHHVARAIYIPRHNYSGFDKLYHINIYNNLCVNLGMTGLNDRCWGIQSSEIREQSASSYIYIINNVFHANPLLTEVTMYGVMIPSVYELSYCYIDNNIIIGFDRAGIAGIFGRITAEYIYIRNNLMYGNGATNDPYLDSNFLSTYDEETYTYSGTVKADPLFVSATDYHLQEGSPAIAAGIWVGLLKDFENKDYYNPPSLGVYEIGTAEPEPEPEPEPGTGQIITDGLGNIITDGLGNVLKK